MRRRTRSVANPVHHPGYRRLILGAGVACLLAAAVGGAGENPASPSPASPVAEAGQASVAQPPVKAGKALPPEDFGFEVLGWLGGPCHAVTIEGDFAYVGEGLGLSIFDLSDIEAPLHVGGIRLPGIEWSGMQLGIVREIVVADGFAYVLVSRDWLPFSSVPPYGTVHVVDVSEPSAPALRASFEAPDDAMDFAKSGGFGYLACVETLQVVDLSDPNTPEARGSAEVVGFTVAVSGDFAYVASMGGMQVVDVTDADSPEPTETVSLGGFYWFDIALAGDRAYLAGMDYDDFWNEYVCTLAVVSLADPAHPSPQGYLEMPSEGSGMRVAAAGDRVYVADGHGAVHVVDVSNPEAPGLVTTCPVYRGATDVALVESRALVASDWAGLMVLDLAAPDSPSVVDSVTVGCPLCLTVSGERLYAVGDGGFTVCDVADAAAARVLGGCTTPGFAGHVAVSGGHAFVADGTGGLQVVDISDPARPACVGSLPTSGEAQLVVAGTDFVYVAEGGRVRVVDVTTAEAPTGRGVVAGAYEGFGRDIGVRGDFVFVGGDSSGISSVDVRDPDVPFLVVQDVGLGIDGIAISGDLIYAEAFGGGLLVCHISPDGALTELGMHPIGSWDAADVAVAGGTAYFPRLESGLQALDVSAPVAPETVGFFRCYEGFHTVEALEDVVYAGGRAGIVLLRATGLAQCEVLADFDIEGELLASMALSLGLDGNGDGLVNGADAVWGNWDLNRDGVADRWQLAVLAHIVCAQDEAYRDQASIAYNTNNALFAADNPEQAADFPHVVAGLLSIGSGMVQPLVDGGLVSDTQPYQAYVAPDDTTHEPLSGEGDMDGDALTGSDEYLRVLLAGGGMDDYVFAVMTPWADGSPLPTADPISLAALIVGLVAARFRRRGSS